MVRIEFRINLYCYNELGFFLFQSSYFDFILRFHSTREIKPNQTDIGRKVKVKQVPGRPLPPQRRDIQLPRDNIAKPSYQPSSVPSKLPVVHSNGLSNGLGNNHVSSTRPKPSMPDIARRPLKYVPISSNLEREF